MMPRFRLSASHTKTREEESMKLKIQGLFSKFYVLSLGTSVKVSSAN